MPVENVPVRHECPPVLRFLKVCLDELGVPIVQQGPTPGILHPAVYLVQAAGVPVRYYFRWSVSGPSGKGLDWDYYLLDTVSDPGRLRDNVLRVIRRVRQTLDAFEAPLDRTGWARLLASLHFLRTRSGCDRLDAFRILHERMEIPEELCSRAERVLLDADLIRWEDAP